MEGAVEELRPLAGTRPACRALGVAPATLYRHLQTAQAEDPAALGDTGAGALEARARGGAL